jgi:hypothetical protein
VRIGSEALSRSNMGKEADAAGFCGIAMALKAAALALGGGERAAVGLTRFCGVNSPNIGQPEALR